MRNLAVPVKGFCMFYITISNGLLNDVHHDRMGNSIWLFMWLIDKVTKIDDEGKGWVLGGAPINLEDIRHIPRRSAQRYLATLKNEGYIEITRTMRGFIVKVLKAKKRFQGAPKAAHGDVPKVAHHNTKSGASLTKFGASNKTVSIDKTVDITIASSPDAGMIEEVINAFKEINPSYQTFFRNRTQRLAASELVAIHSLERVLKVVALLPQTNVMQYVPSITSPRQLQDKWSNLETALRRKKQHLAETQIATF